MGEDMEIRNIITFVRIAELQNFSKAAEQLGYSQSAVTMQIKQLEAELNTQLFERIGKRIKLTQVEYTIMKMFMENPGKALSREEILDMVWGHDYFGEVKIVDVNIRRLRLKIEDNPQNPAYITTVWGYGYKWGF